MLVHRHTEKSLVALGQKMPQPASVILARLRTEDIEGAAALIVARLPESLGRWNGRQDDKATNGDTLVVIARDNIAITAMLRRSWDQDFTPEVLRVDRVIDWTGGTA